jgi:hypothetical protein
MSKARGKKSLRQQRQEKRKKAQLRSRLIMWAGLGGVLLLLGFLVWNSAFRTPIGEQIVATGDGVHLSPGQPLPQYSTNPPTSGPHYNATLGSGFYDEDDPWTEPFQNAPGYIVHSMEHGYVVMWYNCSVVSEAECSSLKENIQAVIEAENQFKIIGFPITTTSQPLVLTSWGYILEMDSWDGELVSTFVDRNRNNAPESTAPNTLKN